MTTIACIFSQQFENPVEKKEKNLDANWSR